MIDPNKLTEKTQEALVNARQRAVENGHSELDVEHLAAALLAQDGGTVPSILRGLGGNPQQLLAAIESDLGKRPRASGGSTQIGASGRLGRLLQQAQKEMAALSDEYVSTEHLFLAMLDDTGTTGQQLKRLGATRERALEALRF